MRLLREAAKLAPFTFGCTMSFPFPIQFLQFAFTKSEPTLECVLSQKTPCITHQNIQTLDQQVLHILSSFYSKVQKYELSFSRTAE